MPTSSNKKDPIIPHDNARHHSLTLTDQKLHIRVERKWPLIFFLDLSLAIVGRSCILGSKRILKNLVSVVQYLQEPQRT